MKFFTYSQNNSGGGYEIDEEHGVGMYVIIEAENETEADKRFDEIGSKVDGMYDYCPCCGERWYGCEDSEGDEVPSIYGTPIEEATAPYWDKTGFVHKNDGTFYPFTVKKD